MSTRSVLSLVFCFSLSWATSSQTSDATSIPDYRARPLFAEMFADHYQEDPANVELMPNGMVRLNPLGTEAIVDFDWRRHKARSDPSWFFRMERFYYMVPFLRNLRHEHEEFVHEWFARWDAAHPSGHFPNAGSRDAMTVGMRGSVIIWYIRELERRDPNDPLIDRLKEQVASSQQYLLKTFAPVSNHGLWEAMGLLETTRLHYDETIFETALDRLSECARIAVSEKGMEVEHSPHYQRGVRKWLRDFADYLVSLNIRSPQVEEVVTVADRMDVAYYYVYDHKYHLAQIGDTDSTVITHGETGLTRREMERLPRVFFDEHGGYAIYKDPPNSRRQRHVIFCIQNRDNPIRMPYHYHNDALAVYFSYDGEVILGDGGRYTYDTSKPFRRHFVSRAAHNVISRAGMLRRGGNVLADDLWSHDDGKKFFFGATIGAESIARAPAGTGVSRVVEVPARSRDILVHDTIEDNHRWVILWNMGPGVASLSPMDVDSSRADLFTTYAWDIESYRGRDFRLEISLSNESGAGGEVISVVEGATDPYLGWYSPSYNVARPIKTIRIVLPVAGSATVTTRIGKK